MPTTAVTSSYASTAAQLISLSGLTETQKLYKDALEAVKSKARSGNKDTDLLDLISSAAGPNDLTSRLKVRPRSRLWRLGESKKTQKIVEKTASTVVRFKEPVTIVVNQTSIFAAPIWSAVCYVTTFVQEIMDARNAHRDFEQEIEHCLRRFDACNGHGQLKPYLRSDLVDFYTVIIEFCRTSSEFLKQSSIGIVWSVTSGTIKEEYDKLLKDLRYASQNVKESMGAQTFERVEDLGKKLNSTWALPDTTGSPSANIYFVNRQLGKYYVGRSKALRSVSDTLSGDHGGQPASVAIWGLGGVGKSQTALRFAHERRLGNGYPQAYRHVFFVRSHSVEALLDDFNAIAISAGLCKHTVDSTESRTLIARVHDWMQRNDSWLLIFDNVSLPSDVRPFVPLSGSGGIIYTTRSRPIAEALTDATHVLALEPFDPATGVELIYKILDVTEPGTQDEWRFGARRLSEVLGGLPMLIEQAMADANASDQTISQMFVLLRNTKILLQKQHQFSSHETDASTAALLQEILKRLESTNRAAVELFKVIVFLDYSSLPIDILHKGGLQLKSHLARTTTYDRGVIITESEERQTIAYRLKLANESRSSRRKSPLQTLRKRLNGRPSSSSAAAADSTFPDGFPRIDSRSDVELQDYYNSNRVLQNLFADPLRIDNAITDLVQFGLVHRLNPKTLWVHDVYAEITQTLIKVESETQPPDPSGQASQQVYIHLAATLLYLDFPIFGHPLRFEDIYPRAPSMIMNARMVVRWMCEIVVWRRDSAEPASDPSSETTANPSFSSSSTSRPNDNPNDVVRLVADATIGPELCHLVGTALNAQNVSLKIPTETNDIDDTAMTWFFRIALDGYEHACSRLLAHPGVTPEVVSSVAKREYRYQATQGFFFYRTLDHEERWGCAPVRLARTQAALGEILGQRRCGVGEFLGRPRAPREKWEQAMSFLHLARDHMERMFGVEHDMYDEVVCSIIARRAAYGDWAIVLRLAEERVEWYRRHARRDIRDCPHGKWMAHTMGNALKGLGRLDEARGWYLQYVLLSQLMHGGDNEPATWAARDVALLEVERGDFAAAREWMTRVVQLRVRTDEVYLRRFVSDRGHAAKWLERALEYNEEVERAIAAKEEQQQQQQKQCELGEEVAVSLKDA